MKRLLCVWLPNWPIQRHWLNSKPSDVGPDQRNESPIVLWQADPRRGRQVVACCTRARALGVRVSMSIAQASEMVQQVDCQPIIHRHEPALDREALNQIANQLQHYISPLVSIESLDKKPWADYPRHQCEAIFCDITGVTHLFADEAGVLAEVNRLLAEQGLVGRLAIAESMGAAWALSHYFDCLPTANHELISTQHGFIAPPGDLSVTLAPLPIEALRLSPETVQTLGRLGVETIGQLLRLPRSGLATRLGNALVKRIQQAIGEVDEPLEVYHAPAEHWATLTLEYPTADQQILADRIGRLMKKVRAGLATRQRGALRMECRLDLSIHPPLTLEIGLFAPTIDADHLSGLIINQLESTELPTCVDRLTITVTHTGPLRTVQQSLFDVDRSNSSMSGSEISRLVDSLSCRLGRDSVLGVQLEDDPLPEKAFSVQPLAGNSISSRNIGPFNSVRNSIRSLCNDESSQPSTLSSPNFSLPLCKQSRSPSPDDSLRRPLCLLLDPLPLEVSFDTSSFFQFLPSPQLPTCVRIGGVIHRIVMHWGPERIETGWWKGPCTRRDYYRIETDSGRWWWIFRNLVSKSQTADTAHYYWMLHGRF